MKRQPIIKCFLLAVCALFGAGLTQAQDFRTDESISSQLKTGSVPGLQYGTVPARKKLNTDRNEGRESSGQQLRNGTMKGMAMAQGSGGARTSVNRGMTKTDASRAGSLPSNQPASAAPQQKSVAPAPVPAQGNVTEAEAMRIEMARPLPKAPTKKVE